MIVMGMVVLMGIIIVLSGVKGKCFMLLNVEYMIY